MDPPFCAATVYLSLAWQRIVAATCRFVWLTELNVSEGAGVPPLCLSVKFCCYSQRFFPMVCPRNISPGCKCVSEVKCISFC